MSIIDTIRTALYGSPPSQAYQPSKEGVIDAFDQVVQSVTVLSGGVVGSTATIRATLALLTAVSPADNTLGLVYDDPEESQNGIYHRTGGAWVFTGLLGTGPEGPGPTSETIDAATAVAVDAADDAEASAIEAGVAADSALAASNYFTSQALGEAGTTTGQFFCTDDGAGNLIYYKRTGGGSTEIGRAATSASVEAIEADVGFLNTAADSVNMSARPFRLDLRIRLCFGRGMLTAEVENTDTLRAITTTAAAGTDTITVGSTTNVVLGSVWMVRYVDGTVGNHFVIDKSPTTIALIPRLRKSVDATCETEQLWRNRGHVGDLGAEWIAQELVNGTELELACPWGDRVLFTDFETNDAAHNLVAVEGATFNYYTESNLNGGYTPSTAGPVRFDGRTAGVTITADGDGYDTPIGAVLSNGQYIARVTRGSQTGGASTEIQVINDAGLIVGRRAIAANVDQIVITHYDIPFSSRNSETLKIREVKTGGTIDDLWVTCCQIFSAPPATGKAHSKPKGRFYLLGDSWGQNDGSNRTGVGDMLLAKLPGGTVVNGSVGGYTSYDADFNFATNAPGVGDTLVLIVGTNDCYNPTSVTFDPDALRNFVNYVNGVATKAALKGMRFGLAILPAMAQRDDTNFLPGGSPDPDDWTLCNRSRTYDRYLERSLGRLTAIDQAQVVLTGGVLLMKTANENGLNFSTAAAVTFNREVYDDHTLHSGSNSKIIIPSSLNGKKARFAAQAWLNNVDADNYTVLEIRQNGSNSWDGVAASMVENSIAAPRGQCQTAVVTLATGQEYELFLSSEADTSLDIIAFGTWFEMRLES